MTAAVWFEVGMAIGLILVGAVFLLAELVLRVRSWVRRRRDVDQAQLDAWARFGDAVDGSRR